MLTCCVFLRWPLSYTHVMNCCADKVCVLLTIRVLMTNGMLLTNHILLTISDGLLTHCVATSGLSYVWPSAEKEKLLIDWFVENLSENEIVMYVRLLIIFVKFFYVLALLLLNSLFKLSIEYFLYFFFCLFVMCRPQLLISLMGYCYVFVFKVSMCCVCFFCCFLSLYILQGVKPKSPVSRRLTVSDQNL